MRKLMEFETSLSQIMIQPQSRRNFSEIYTKLPLGELKRRVPDFDFDYYLASLLPRKLDDSELVVIYALPYYRKLTKLLEATDKRSGS